MPISSRLRALALSITLAALASCGDPPVTSDRYVDQANAACRVITERFKNMTPPATADLPATLQRSLDASEAGAESLRALSVPPEQQASARAMLKAIDDANASLRAAIVAARKKDQAAVTKAAKDIAEAQQRFRRAADDLGLLDCVTAGVEK